MTETEKGAGPGWSIGSFLLCTLKNSWETKQVVKHFEPLNEVSLFLLLNPKIVTGGRKSTKYKKTSTLNSLLTRPSSVCTRFFLPSLCMYASPKHQLPGSRYLGLLKTKVEDLKGKLIRACKQVLKSYLTEKEKHVCIFLPKLSLICRLVI